MIPLGILAAVLGSPAKTLQGLPLHYNGGAATSSSVWDIGAPSPERTLVIVVMTNSGQSRSINSVTLNGATLTASVASTGNRSRANIYTAQTDGTEAAIDIVLSSTVNTYTRVYVSPVRLMVEGTAAANALIGTTTFAATVPTAPSGVLVAGVTCNNSGGMAEGSPTPALADMAAANKLLLQTGTLPTDGTDITMTVTLVNGASDSVRNAMALAAYAPWPDDALFVDDFAGTSRPLTNDYEAVNAGTNVATATATNGVVAFQSTDGAEFYMRQVNYADVDVSLVIDGLSSIRRAWAIGARISSGYAINIVGLSGIPNSGYTFEVNNDSPNNNGIYRNGVKVASSSPEVARITQDAQYKMRLRAQGGLVQGKCWLLAEPEPEAWTFEYIDPDPLPAGGVGFGNRNSGNRPTTARAPFMALAI